MSAHETYQQYDRSVCYQIINEEDDSSISMEDDFCVFNPTEIAAIPEDCELSPFPSAVSTHVIESGDSGREGQLTHRSRKAGKQKKQDNRVREENSHTNPAFEDDDELVNAKDRTRSSDYGREREMGSVNVKTFKKEISGDIIAGSDIELLEIKSPMAMSVTKVNVQPNVYQDMGSSTGRHPSLRHMHKSKQSCITEDDDESEEKDKEQSSKLPKKDIRINFSEPVTPKLYVTDEDKGRQSVKPSLQPITRPRRTGEESRSVRPLSRSISDFKFPSEESKTTATLAVPTRSQSMRIASSSGAAKGKPRKLLRELSFSDADGQTIRNYGALRGVHSIPKRIQRQATTDKENDDCESCGDPETKATSEIKEHLVDLMHELLGRGKVHHIAVLDQDNAKMLACLPVWDLDSREIMGVIKAVKWTQQAMLKLNFDDQTYTCFKHGPNKLVGRAGNSVLVVQLTDTCAVIGVSDDDTPGSCHYEVSELTQALVDKGWGREPMAHEPDVALLIAASGSQTNL